MFHQSSEMLILLALLLLVDQSSARCDSTSDTGKIVCIKIKAYYGYQWSTCLTNSYIKEKSKQLHVCTGYSTYCYYQCMLEAYGKENGNVYGNCECYPGEDPPVKANLPGRCYSPSGDYCSWYANCLSKKYDCEPSSNGYALEYAQKICTLYEEHEDWFSKDGQQWLDETRKCIQVSMVTLLRPWSKPVCQDIRQKAIATYGDCYTDGVTSWCDLTFNENMFIFWKLKRSFVNKPLLSLENLHKTGKKCKWSNNNTRQLKPIELRIERWQNINKTCLSTINEESFGESVVSSIAKWLNWDTYIQLDWFAYDEESEKVSIHVTAMSIVVILADKEAVMNKKNTSSAWQSYLDDTLQKFKKAVNTSDLPTEVEGKRVWVKFLSACTDLWCTGKEVLTESKQPDDYRTDSLPVPKRCEDRSSGSLPVPKRCENRSSGTSSRWFLVISIFVSMLFVLSIIM